MAFNKKDFFSGQAGDRNSISQPSQSPTTLYATVKFIKIIVSIALFSCLGCHSQTKKQTIAPNSIERNLSSYKEVPGFLRKALAAHISDTSDIADPNEMWESGCTRLGELPHKHMEWAKINETQFQMAFSTGGLASTLHFVLIEFEDETIKSLVIQKL